MGTMMETMERRRIPSDLYQQLAEHPSAEKFEEEDGTKIVRVSRLTFDTIASEQRRRQARETHQALEKSRRRQQRRAGEASRRRNRS